MGTWLIRAGAGTVLATMVSTFVLFAAVHTACAPAGFEPLHGVPVETVKAYAQCWSDLWGEVVESSDQAPPGDGSLVSAVYRTLGLIGGAFGMVALAGGGMVARWLTEAVKSVGGGRLYTTNTQMSSWGRRVMGKITAAVICLVSSFPLVVLAYLGLPSYQAAVNAVSDGVPWLRLYIWVLPLVLLAMGDGFALELLGALVSEWKRLRSELFVLAAWARGANLARHIWRRLTVVGLAVSGSRFSYLLGAAIVIERVFTWKEGGVASPGIGERLFHALVDKDEKTLMGTVLAVVVITQAVGLFQRWTQYMLDPPSRGEG